MNERRGSTDVTTRRKVLNKKQRTEESELELGSKGRERAGKGREMG
jgi:hypothetical protein